MTTKRQDPKVKLPKRVWLMLGIYSIATVAWLLAQKSFGTSHLWSICAFGISVLLIGATVFVYLCWESESARG